MHTNLEIKIIRHELEEAEGEKAEHFDVMDRHFEALLRTAAEAIRLNDRDCNATIELCYDDSPGNPFERETLKILDVGVADNIYIVESETINALMEERESL